MLEFGGEGFFVFVFFFFLFQAIYFSVQGILIENCHVYITSSTAEQEADRNFNFYCSLILQIVASLPSKWSPG